MSATENTEGAKAPSPLQKLDLIRDREVIHYISFTAAGVGIVFWEERLVPASLLETRARIEAQIKETPSNNLAHYNLSEISREITTAGLTFYNYYPTLAEAIDAEWARLGLDEEHAL